MTKALLDRIEVSGTGMAKSINGGERVDGDITVQIGYLERNPTHAFEKPYAIAYDTGGIVPTTNMADEQRLMTIHDFDDVRSPKSFDELGFTVSKLECDMALKDYHEDEKVEKFYYTAVEQLLRQTYREVDSIRFLEHARRRRRVFVPDGELLEDVQPATGAHSDITPESAIRTAQANFGMKPEHYSRVVMVNFWKSLQGGGNDWPLALCDWRSVDYADDVTAADVVFHNRFTENQRVYHNPRHDWYYVKDLADDEVIMFRQMDSDIEGGGGVPHVSFDSPRTEAHAAPRESIEVRAFLFFK